VVNAQTRTDARKGLGNEGAAAVGNHVLGHPIAQTGGIEHRQRYPTGLRGGHRTCQHRARIAVEDDAAPPPVALQGTIHHAAVDKPVLVRRGRFEGMRLRLGLRGALRRRAWNVLIDPSVERHDALDGPHRQIVFAPETPDAKAAGIGMAFL
jgi:hypothetical protein